MSHLAPLKDSTGRIIGYRVRNLQPPGGKPYDGPRFYRGMEDIPRRHIFTDPKRRAEEWRKREEASFHNDEHIRPRDRKITVNQLIDEYWWPAWVANVRPNTQRTAKTQLRYIRERFGDRELNSIQHHEIGAWMADMRAGKLGERRPMQASTLMVTHGRFVQLYAYAMKKKNGFVPPGGSPLDDETMPKKVSRRKPDMLDDRLIWDLHDAMEPRYAIAILLGAYAGLRISEVCGLNVRDVDFLHHVINPTQQVIPDGPLRVGPLKTDTSSYWPIDVSPRLTEAISAHVQSFPSAAGWVLTRPRGGLVRSTRLDEQFQAAKAKVPEVPEWFTTHKLRAWFGSMLIAEGHDILVVQHQMRHEQPSTTMNFYGYVRADRGDRARASATARWRPDEGWNDAVVRRLA